jgi:hypothetical protein
MWWIHVAYIRRFRLANNLQICRRLPVRWRTRVHHVDGSALAQVACRLPGGDQPQVVDTLGGRMHVR